MANLFSIVLCIGIAAYLANGQPGNDLICDAITVTQSLPIDFTISGATTINATVDADDIGTDSCGTSISAAGVWYRLEIPNVDACNCDDNNPIPYIINTIQSFDTKLSIFEADSCNGPFTCIAGNDDGGAGVASKVEFDGCFDELYILLHGFGSATGTTDIEINANATCISDIDGDNVPDEIDNCPDVPNPEQGNIDGDNVGDACDYDIDGDWIPNEWDYCPTSPGPFYNYGCPINGPPYGPAFGWRGRNPPNREPFPALQNDEKMIGENNDHVMDNEHMKINISTNTMINIWCMAILFIVVNAILCICYNRNKITVEKSYLPS